MGIPVGGCRFSASPFALLIWNMSCKGRLRRASKRKGVGEVACPGGACGALRRRLVRGLPDASHMDFCRGGCIERQPQRSRGCCVGAQHVTRPVGKISSACFRHTWPMRNASRESVGTTSTPQRSVGRHAVRVFPSCGLRRRFCKGAHTRSINGRGRAPLAWPGRRARTEHAERAGTRRTLERSKGTPAEAQCDPAGHQRNAKRNEGATHQLNVNTASGSLEKKPGGLSRPPTKALRRPKEASRDPTGPHGTQPETKGMPNRSPAKF